MLSNFGQMAKLDVKTAFQIIAVISGLTEIPINPALAQIRSGSLNAETAILKPICPPAGTIRKSGSTVTTAHGFRADNNAVCTFDTNGVNDIALLGYMGVPSDEINEARDIIAGVITGGRLNSPTMFMAKYWAGTNEETIIRIPGKKVQMDDGTIYNTRGILRHVRAIFTGKVHEQEMYFPIVGEYIYMSAIEKIVTKSQGGDWPGLKATSYSPVPFR